MQRLRGLGKALGEEEKRQKAAEGEWQARRLATARRHKNAEAAREAERIAQGEQKILRLEEIDYVRKSSMLLRSEESKIRREERMDHVQRMQRVKEHGRLMKAEELEKKQQRDAKVQDARNKIKAQRKQMVMQFFVEKKKLKEQQRRDKAMLSVGP